jgi:hypothetical protein
MVRYEISESDRSRDGDEWQVTAVNHDSDGEIYLAFFVGSDSRERAVEYAAWKNGHPQPVNLKSMADTQLANPL